MCFHSDFMSTYIEFDILGSEQGVLQWEQRMLMLKESGKSVCRNVLWSHFQSLFILFFSTPLTLEVFFFCHVSAWKCSKRWVLTLTLCRAPSQWEVLRHHRMHWSVCTNCPPWSHSCFKPSAGISGHSCQCQSSTPPDIVLFCLIAPVVSVSVLYSVYSLWSFVFKKLQYTQCFHSNIESHDGLHVNGFACGDEPRNPPASAVSLNPSI